MCIATVAVLTTGGCVSDDDPDPRAAAQELVEALEPSSEGRFDVSEQEHKLEESSYSAVGTIAAQTRDGAIDTISAALTDLGWTVDSAGETELSLGYRIAASRSGLRAEVFTGPGGRDVPGFDAQPEQMWVALRVATADGARGWQ